MKEKEKKKLLTLRIPPSLQKDLQEMAREQRRTMTDIIQESLEKTILDFREILEYEKKGILVPCENCGEKISFYDLKKQGTHCPKCGNKVRMLRAPK